MAVPSQTLKGPEGYVNEKGNLVIEGKEYSLGPLGKNYDISYKDGKLVVIDKVTGGTAEYWIGEYSDNGVSFRLVRSSPGYTGPERLAFTRVEEITVDIEGVPAKKSKEKPKGQRESVSLTKGLKGGRESYNTTSVNPVEDIEVNIDLPDYVPSPVQSSSKKKPKVELKERIEITSNIPSTTELEKPTISKGQMERGQMEEKRGATGGGEKAEEARGGEIPQGRVEMGGTTLEMASVQQLSVGPYKGHYIYFYGLPSELEKLAKEPEWWKKIVDQHLSQIPEGVPVIITTSGKPDMGGRNRTYIIEVNDIGIVTSTYTARV